MQKRSFHFLLFSFLVLFTSCSQKDKPLNLDNWVGDYYFEENTVKANAGYAMSMEWSLSVKKQKDSYNAVVEINGQQTYMKLSANISGDSNKIAIAFNDIIDGSTENFNKNDTLFILSKKKEQLFTEWKILEPRLSLEYPKECNCFIPTTQNNNH